MLKFEIQLFNFLKQMSGFFYVLYIIIMLYLF